MIEEKFQKIKYSQIERLAKEIECPLNFQETWPKCATNKRAYCGGIEYSNKKV